MSEIVVISISSASIKIGSGGQERPAKRFTKLQGVTNELKDEEQLYMVVRDYFLDVLLKGTTKFHILLVEDVLCSLVEKRSYCDVLLKRLECLSITFLPNAIASCIAGTVTDGLVVDIGWNHTTCTPIYDLRIIDNCIMSSKKAERWFRENLEIGLLATEMLTSFVGVSNSSLEYECDELPMTCLIQKTVESLDLDMRKPLSRNIILCGYLNDDRNLRAKLLAASPVGVQVIENVDSWRGGSIYSTYLSERDNVAKSLRITRASYENPHCKIPDWHELKFANI